MCIAAYKYVPATILLGLPGSACAQEISPLIGALALSPIVVFLLAFVLGIVARSWRVAAAHAALVAVWLLLFGIASYRVENDYVIWTPLALYAIHALVMSGLIVQRAMRRIREPAQGTGDRDQERGRRRPGRTA